MLNNSGLGRSSPHGANSRLSRQRSSEKEEQDHDEYQYVAYEDYEENDVELIEGAAALIED